MTELDNVITYHENFSLKKQILPKVTYIDRLLNLNINVDVINWIQNNLDTIGKISGKITNEHLFSLILLGHATLSIPFDPIELNKILKINLQKVSGLLSGTNSTQSALSHLSVTIPIIIISPKNYISKIITSFCQKILFDGDLPKLIENVEIFTDELCKKYKIILQDNPNDMAMAISFYYLSLCIKGKKINKSDFIIEGFDKQKFSKSYKTLLKILEK